MIFVFKTSVKTKKQIIALKPQIDNILPKARWSFDLEDCDKILRIESEENIAREIQQLLTIHSFYCEELD